MKIRIKTDVDVEEDLVLDKNSGIPLYSDVCVFCKHVKIPVPETAERFCAAFPDGTGIPMEIWLGQNDHRSPYRGDHGIQFEESKP